MRVERKINAGYAELQPTSIDGRVAFRETLPVNVSFHAASRSTTVALGWRTLAAKSSSVFAGAEQKDNEKNKLSLVIGYSSGVLLVIISLFWRKMRADNRVEPSQVMIAFNLQHACAVFQISTNNPFHLGRSQNGGTLRFVPSPTCSRLTVKSGLTGAWKCRMLGLKWNISRLLIVSCQC